MSTRIYEHIRANVIGYMALFIAFSGTAWAANQGGSPVGQGGGGSASVGSNDIKSDAIKQKHVARNAIGSGQIGSGAVNSSEIGAGGVGSSEIADKAVNSSKIGAGAVGTQNLTFDPATQSELDHTLVDNEFRFFPRTELQTSDGSAPNVGANRVNWNILGNVPAGFADGVDDTGGGGGPASDLNCATCVSAGELVDGASLSELLDDDGTGSGLNADLLDGLSSSAFAPAGPATDLDCTGCVSGGDLADGTSLAEIDDDDGAGSGLDADLLDGLSSSAFAPAAHNHDDRYFTEAELQTSDGSAPNTGVNRMHWNNLTGVPADFADGIDDTAGAGSGWLLGGNAGTNPATDFLGTTDNQPLNLRVNNARAFRLEPGTLPNLIGGAASNAVTAAVIAATIGGGQLNSVTDNAGTIGGGSGNLAGDDAGTLLDATTATVSGGASNTASADQATVGGGFGNNASADHATVGGGETNTATGQQAFLGGGVSNSASGIQSFVGGGFFNDASDLRTTVGGGGLNTASEPSATVGGGASNTASAIQSTVGGGTTNTATAQAATVGGGGDNDATGASATVAGGNSNIASGMTATVGGGAVNSAAGDFSFLAGRRAKNTNAAHDGVFMFADSSNFDFSSAAANEFAVRSTGGARFVSAIDGTGTPTAGVTLAAGGGSWASLSDRASKTAVEPISGREVLDKLADVPVSTWSYDAQGSGVRHIGPMAQDFARAFGVGEDERHITSIDADGVALAAIKGLNERIEALDGGGGASGLSISPAVLAGIAALALTLAAALGAAVALGWNGRLRGGWATS